MSNGNNAIKIRSTAKQRRKLKQIVLDCNLKRYTNDETLEYIQSTTGKHMTIRNLLYIKAEIKKDTGVWLDGLAGTRLSYVAEYRERIDEILSYQKALQELYRQSLEQKNSILALHIIKELHALTMTLTRFYNSAPIIHALKDRIMSNNNAIEDQQNKEEEQEKEHNSNNPNVSSPNNS